MKKYIGYYENIVESEICDSIITYTEKSKVLTPSTYSTSAGKTARSSERVSMDDSWFKNADKYYTEIKECYEKVIKKYQKEHSDFRCEKHTDFRLNKYPKDGFMSRHTDAIHHSHGQQYGYPQVSSLLFLNDDYEGGEFIICDMEYKPKKGSSIIFPSNFMFPHEVLKITNGIRYSIITWLM